MPAHVASMWHWTLTGAIVAGILGILGSSVFVAMLPHGEIVLPWEFPLYAIVSVMLSGIFLGLYIYVRPGAYLPTIVLTNLLTVGVSVLRYPIYDEFLTACVVVGALAAVIQRRVRYRNLNESTKLWAVVTMLLLAHWMVMSVVGLVTFGNLKAARFVLVYLETLVGIALWVRYDFPLPDKKAMVGFILWAGFWYYVAVLLHGLGANLIRIQENIMEGIGFVGTSYLNAIGIVVVPVALIAIAERRWRLGALAAINLLLALVIVVLSDSRGGMLPFVVSFILAPICLGLARTLKMVAVISITLVILGWAMVGRAEWVLDMAEGIIDAFRIESGTSTFEYFGRTVTAAKGDAGRLLYFQAGAAALADNPAYWLTGSGGYGFFPVAGPYYERIAESRGISTNVINYGTALAGIAEPPRPPAAGALLIETGLVGAGLLIALVIAAVSHAVLRMKPVKGPCISRRGLLAAVPAICVLPLTYFGEMQDMVLVYLIIAPLGVTSFLADRSDPAHPVM